MTVGPWPLLTNLGETLTTTRGAWIVTCAVRVVVRPAR